MQCHHCTLSVGRKRAVVSVCSSEVEMGREFWDRDAATVLSPAVGAVAPAICLWLQGGAGMNAIAIGGPCVWAIAGLALSYAIALPVVVVARGLGVRGLLGLWLSQPLSGHRWDTSGQTRRCLRTIQRSRRRRTGAPCLSTWRSSVSPACCTLRVRAASANGRRALVGQNQTVTEVRFRADACCEA